MSYSGSVTVIDGLIPANGQSFPLVNAANVYVDDDMTLADYIAFNDGSIEDLGYKPITIKSLSIASINGVSGEVTEKGTVVTRLGYSYECNKAPDELTFNYVEVSEPAATGSNIEISGLNVTSDTEFTLAAVDNGTGTGTYPRITVTSSVTLHFYDKIHWGVNAVPGSYDNTFLLTTLTNHELAPNRNKTFTVNAGSGKYIFFALPTSMGTPKFTVGGFDGGFTKVAEFSHTNSTGNASAATTYAVWKSDNANLGSTTVKVS